MFANPMITLNNDVEIPQLGVGVMRAKTQQAMDAQIHAAFEAGCTLFDGALCYGNEREMSASIRRELQARGMAREDVFITTKSSLKNHGYEDALRVFKEQLSYMHLDYIDMYLIHWPVPQDTNTYLECWNALERMYTEGKVRAIGVSNHFVKHLEAIRKIGTVVPAVDQVQLNPYYVNEEVVEYCQQRGIAVECWSPLGGGNKALYDETVAELAARYGGTPAQVILNWEVSKGYIVIPGSTNPMNIKAEFEALDFALSDEDSATMDALNRHEPDQGPNSRGYNPDTFPLAW